MHRGPAECAEAPKRLLSLTKENYPPQHRVPHSAWPPSRRGRRIEPAERRLRRAPKGGYLPALGRKTRDDCVGMSCLCKLHCNAQCNVRGNAQCNGQCNTQCNVQCNLLCNMQCNAQCNVQCSARYTVQCNVQRNVQWGYLPDLGRKTR